MFNFFKTKYRVNGFRGKWVIEWDFGNGYFNLSNEATGVLMRDVPEEALTKI